jgi:hypothetical protein
MNDNPTWSTYSPAVPKRWLLLIAGGMWSGVSIMLLNYALTWLTHPLTTINIFLGILGVGLSIWANKVQFSHLAKKNIDRIAVMNDKVCLFAFQAWKGYLIIAIMITGGILLRHSAIPKPYLAVVYATIGGALLQASVHYYLRFFRLVGKD